MEFDDHLFSWVLIYMILVYLVDAIISIFNIDNYFFSLFFAGFILALGSFIIYSFLYKKDIVFDGLFLIWVPTQVFSYLLISSLLNVFIINSQFLYYLLFGIILNLLTHNIKHQLYGKFINIKH